MTIFSFFWDLYTYHYVYYSFQKGGRGGRQEAKAM